MSQIDSLKLLLESVILNPHNAEFLAILKAARNGAVYGAKVRFPHALVMTFLFRSGTPRDKLAVILKATQEHAQTLAKFAAVYKTTMLLLKHFGPNAGKEGPYDTFFAGLLGGYLIFGRQPKSRRISSISKQIVIFVFARVCLSLALVSVDPSVGIIRSPTFARTISNKAWPVFASLSWGFIMWLFRWYPATIQSGLKSSMDYIYLQSDHWDSLRNFLIHNQ